MDRKHWMNYGNSTYFQTSKAYFNQQRVMEKERQSKLYNLFILKLLIMFVVFLKMES